MIVTRNLGNPRTQNCHATLLIHLRHPRTQPASLMSQLTSAAAASFRRSRNLCICRLSPGVSWSSRHASPGCDMRLHRRQNSSRQPEHRTTEWPHTHALGIFWSPHMQRVCRRMADSHGQSWRHAQCVVTSGRWSLGSSRPFATRVHPVWGRPLQKLTLPPFSQSSQNWPGLFLRGPRGLQHSGSVPCGCHRMHSRLWKEAS